MESYIKVEKGKMTSKEHLTGLFKSLIDGEYIVIIENISEKDENSYRKKYFAIIQIVSNYTGHSKDELHEEFKIHSNIETTKDYSVLDWVHHIKSFREYIFEKLDILL